MFNKSEYDDLHQTQISGEPQSEWEPESPDQPSWGLPGNGMDQKIPDPSSWGLPGNGMEQEMLDEPSWQPPENGIEPETPAVPSWQPPENGMEPETPAAPSWQPPENGIEPETPAEPFWQLPENGIGPEIPEPAAPTWGPPAGAGAPSVPEDGDDTRWKPPVGTPGVQVSPCTPGMVTERFCTLRFLHAAVDQPAVDITVNRTDPVAGLQYGELTGYFAIRAGRVVVTVRQAGTNRALNQTRFLLENGGIYTIAVINGAAGIALFLMEDVSCRKSVYNSCIRAVNLTSQAPVLDIVLSGGRKLFSNVRFLDVTGYRQLSAGIYDFSAAESGVCLPDTILPDRQAVQIIPVVVGKDCQPVILVTAQRAVEQDRVYTLYIIGNAYSEPYLNMILAESYFEY